MRQMDFAPPIVLRFTDGQLLDVSAEFQPYFDQEIAKAARRAGCAATQRFQKHRRQVDALAAPSSLEGLRHERLFAGVKLKVLEIVWSYVYSGREEEAWHSLADMWPAEDVDRIRAAILQARAHGIRAQVDGVSTASRAAGKIK